MYEFRAYADCPEIEEHERAGNTPQVASANVRENLERLNLTVHRMVMDYIHNWTVADTASMVIVVTPRTGQLDLLTLDSQILSSLNWHTRSTQPAVRPFVAATFAAWTIYTTMVCDESSVRRLRAVSESTATPNAGGTLFSRITSAFSETTSTQTSRDNRTRAGIATSEAGTVAQETLRDAGQGIANASRSLANGLGQTGASFARGLSEGLGFGSVGFYILAGGAAAVGTLLLVGLVAKTARDVKRA